MSSLKTQNSTVGQVAVCKKEDENLNIDGREYCFVLRPGFCSRRLTIVGSKYCNSIRDVVFLSDDVLLFQFKSGLRAKFEYNGVMKYLERGETELLQDQAALQASIVDSNFCYQESKHFVMKYSHEVEVDAPDKPPSTNLKRITYDAKGEL